MIIIAQILAFVGAVLGVIGLGLCLGLLLGWAAARLHRRRARRAIAAEALRDWTNWSRKQSSGASRRSRSGT